MKAATIKQLEATGAFWLKFQKEWATLEDLREGYETIKAKVTEYIHRRTAEDDETYLLRVKNLSYTPILATTIREFSAKLSSAPISVNGLDLTDGNFWDLFFQAIDGKTQDESELLNDIFSTVLWYGAVYVAVDLPPLTTTPRSRAEDPSDRVPFIRVFKPINVRQKGDGWYQTRQIVNRQRPLEDPKTILQWCYWCADATTLYELEIDVDMFGTVTRCRKVGSDTWVAFNDQLVIEPSKVLANITGRSQMVDLELPRELWLALQAYPKQIEHLIVENSWLSAGAVAGTIQRVFTPTPPKPMDDVRVAYEETDYSGLKSDNQHILIGNGFSFNESTGAAIGALTQQLETIERQIRSLASLNYASVEQGAVDQSGASKQVDMDMMVTSMQAYGKKIKQIYEDVLKIASAIAGRNEAPQVSGLDAYGTASISDMLTQTEQLLKLIDIFPSAAMKLWVAKLVEACLGNLNVPDQSVVVAELEALDIEALKAQLAADKQATLKPASVQGKGK